jgi:hypothetical protein
MSSIMRIIFSMRFFSVIVVILYNYFYLNVIHFNLLKKGALSESHVLQISCQKGKFYWFKY